MLYLGAGLWGCAAWVVSGGSAFGLMDKRHRLYFIHESCHCVDGVLPREDGSHGGNVRTDVLYVSDV